MYALRFNKCLLKIGQTTSLARAQGKIGYSKEISLFGFPECILLCSSSSRLEDESMILGVCRFLFNEPIRGREWFSCTIQCENISLLAGLFEKKIFERKWDWLGDVSVGLRGRTHGLKRREYNKRRGLVVDTREGRHTMILTNGECIRISISNVIIIG